MFPPVHIFGEVRAYFLQLFLGGYAIAFENPKIFLCNTSFFRKPHKKAAETFLPALQVAEQFVSFPRNGYSFGDHVYV